MIEVSCAIIFEEGKILAVQRGVETDHPFQWEFPGGKIRKEESPEESIRREIREELLLDIEVMKQLNSIKYDYGIKQILLLPFVCRISAGTVILTEHIAMRWLLPAEIGEIKWSEADRKLIQENALFFNLQEEWKI